MVEWQQIIHKPRLLFKWSILIILWISSFLILLIITGNNKLSLIYPNVASSELDSTSLRNTIRAFNYRRWDPNENYRPICSIRFEKLCAENNKLGFFKTALHKVVKIQDLELKFYRYTPDIATKFDISPVSGDVPTDVEILVKSIVHRLTAPTDGWRISIDLGNVSEVYVSNFDYKIFNDSNLFFAAHSRKAIVSYEHSHVLLQGHAKITIADGSTLESNNIKWDVEKQHFSASGVYVLRQGGNIITGKGICVDAQLKSIERQYAKSEGKEQICITKL